MSRETASPPVPGLAIVDKPAGLTSHDVVGKLRRTFGTRKVGHAGTLDPMATGVLVIGIERATKILGHLALDGKSYLATIALGASTRTDDAEGEVLTTADASHLDDDAIAAAVDTLTGDIDQVPSAVSAIKVDGRRAYDRVRAGEDVNLPARPVTVSRFDVLDRRPGVCHELDVLVGCSSGTYVRALARDLGAALGVGGHLTALRRTTVGPFTLGNARSLEQLAADPVPTYTLDEAVRAAFTSHIVDAATARAVRYGQPVPSAGIAGTYGVLSSDGQALALATDSGKRMKSVIVLAPA